MKKFKDFLTDKGISESDFATKSPEEMAQLYNAYNEACLKTISEDVANKANKEDIPNIDEAIKGLVSKDVFTKLEDTLKAQGLELTKLKENGGKKVAKTMSDELKDNVEELKTIAKGLSSKEVVIKADTVRANVVGNQNALDLQGIGQLAHAKLTAYDIFTKIPVSDSNTNGTIRYYDWDAATIARAADTIAEGGTFPESTAKWVTKTLPIEKIGDTLPVSEEFFEDSAMFAAELGMFLDTNVKIKRNGEIVNGDGITPNLKGIVTTVPTYTAPTSGISDASIYDLFVKVSEDITATGGSKYAPDFGLMNIVDINLMKLKKDANENYIIPPFVSRDGSVVAGMVVLEENSIVANTMVIGDRRYARIYERAGITMSRGMINAQFAEDMETLKVRTRLAFLIRGADEGGFRKVTSISAALALLATP
jgi:HK97 family phage major capsid protein